MSEVLQPEESQVRDALASFNPGAPAAVIDAAYESLDLVARRNLVTLAIDCGYIEATAWNPVKSGKRKHSISPKKPVSASSVSLASSRTITIC